MAYFEPFYRGIGNAANEIGVKSTSKRDHFHSWWVIGYSNS